MNNLNNQNPQQESDINTSNGNRKIEDLEHANREEENTVEMKTILTSDGKIAEVTSNCHLILCLIGAIDEIKLIFTKIELDGFLLLRDYAKSSNWHSLKDPKSKEEESSRLFGSLKMNESQVFGLCRKFHSLYEKMEVKCSETGEKQFLSDCVAYVFGIIMFCLPYHLGDFMKILILGDENDRKLAYKIWNVHMELETNHHTERDGKIELYSKLTDFETTDPLCIRGVFNSTVLSFLNSYWDSVERYLTASFEDCSQKTALRLSKLASVEEKYSEEYLDQIKVFFKYEKDGIDRWILCLFLEKLKKKEIMEQMVSIQLLNFLYDHFIGNEHSHHDDKVVDAFLSIFEEAVSLFSINGIEIKLMGSDELLKSITVIALEYARVARSEKTAEEGSYHRKNIHVASILSKWINRFPACWSNTFTRIHVACLEHCLTSLSSDKQKNRELLEGILWDKNGSFLKDKRFLDVKYSKGCGPREYFDLEKGIEELFRFYVYSGEIFISLGGKFREAFECFNKSLGLLFVGGKNSILSFPINIVFSKTLFLGIILFGGVFDKFRSEKISHPHILPHEIILESMGRLDLKNRIDNSSFSSTTIHYFDNFYNQLLENNEVPEGVEELISTFSNIRSTTILWSHNIVTDRVGLELRVYEEEELKSMLKKKFDNLKGDRESEYITLPRSLFGEELLFERSFYDLIGSKERKDKVMREMSNLLSNEGNIVMLVGEGPMSYTRKICEKVKNMGTKVDDRVLFLSTEYRSKLDVQKEYMKNGEDVVEDNVKTSEQIMKVECGMEERFRCIFDFDALMFLSDEWSEMMKEKEIKAKVPYIQFNGPDGYEAEILLPRGILLAEVGDVSRKMFNLSVFISKVFKSFSKIQGVGGLVSLVIPFDIGKVWTKNVLCLPSLKDGRKCRIGEILSSDNIVDFEKHSHPVRETDEMRLEMIKIQSIYCYLKGRLDDYKVGKTKLSRHEVKELEDEVEEFLKLLDNNERFQRRAFHLYGIGNGCISGYEYVGRKLFSYLGTDHYTTISGKDSGFNLYVNFLFKKFNDFSYRKPTKLPKKDVLSIYHPSGKTCVQIALKWKFNPEKHVIEVPEKVFNESRLELLRLIDEGMVDGVSHSNIAISFLVKGLPYNLVKEAVEVGFSDLSYSKIPNESGLQFITTESTTGIKSLRSVNKENVNNIRSNMEKSLRKRKKEDEEKVFYSGIGEYEFIFPKLDNVEWCEISVGGTFYKSVGCFQVEPEDFKIWEVSSPSSGHLSVSPRGFALRNERNKIKLDGMNIISMIVSSEVGSNQTEVKVEQRFAEKYDDTFLFGEGEKRKMYSLRKRYEELTNSYGEKKLNKLRILAPKVLDVRNQASKFRNFDENEFLGGGVMGLVNLGNTCYMNSILQCLLQTKDIVIEFGDWNSSGEFRSTENVEVRAIHVEEKTKLVVKGEMTKCKEDEIVGGKGGKGTENVCKACGAQTAQFCSECKSTNYCSEDCEKLDRKNHWKECEKISRPNKRKKGKAKIEEEEEETLKVAGKKGKVKIEEEEEETLKVAEKNVEKNIDTSKVIALSLRFIINQIYLCGDTSQPFSPVNIANEVSRFVPNLFRQQDAHELLLFLSDLLPNRDSTFGFKMKQRVVCSKCKKPSDNYNIEHLISIPVIEGRVDLKKEDSGEEETEGEKDQEQNGGESVDLVDCMRYDFKLETMEGSEKYECEQCGLVKASKQTFLSSAKLPRNLTIHLKRFNFNRMNTTADKIQTMVQFPLELNVKEFTDVSEISSSTDDGEFIYSLYGVVVHYGQSLRGTGNHYVSYVCPVSFNRNLEGFRDEGKWYRVSDSSVVEVGVNVVLKLQSYILFYEKN